MSTTYTISVENARGANTSYAVFMDNPEFGGGYQPWMNVWYSSFVPNGGNFDIRTGVDFYACTGTVPSRPNPGVNINSGMNLFSNLGTTSNPGSTFDVKVVEGFPVLTEATPAALPGSFQFNIGDGVGMPNDRYLVGLAKVNNRGQVVPVSSILPQSQTKVQVRPRMKFFVSEGQQVPGEIVDYESVVRSAATIDFADGPGRGKFYARVVQNNEGRFTVTYYDS